MNETCGLCLQRSPCLSVLDHLCQSCLSSTQRNRERQSIAREPPAKSDIKSVSVHSRRTQRHDLGVASCLSKERPSSWQIFPRLIPYESGAGHATECAECVIKLRHAAWILWKSFKIWGERSGADGGERESVVPLDRETRERASARVVLHRIAQHEQRDMAGVR